MISVKFTCTGTFTYRLMMSLNELFQLKNPESSTDIINFVTSSYAFSSLKEIILNDYSNPYELG